MGVGAIVAESVVVFTVITFVGAAYLVYLCVQAIRHGHNHTRLAATVSKRRSVLRLLREGFFVGVSNPKTIVFFLAILSQFVSYRTGAIPLQMAILGLIFFAMALVVDSMWALATGTAQAWFAPKPQRLSNISAGWGVMMIGLGGALALTGSKTRPTARQDRRHVRKTVAPARCYPQAAKPVPTGTTVTRGRCVRNAVIDAIAAQP